MARQPATVEQVREAQELFKEGMAHHEAKRYNEAIAAFTKCAFINPHDANHLPDLKSRLVRGSFKLVQESIAYMGCAAVHLSRMVAELKDDAKKQVPVDEELQKVFQGWE